MARRNEQTNPYLIDTLIRLHARGCLVLAEITCLLEGGFASAAMSRWRTLHEICVVGAFLAHHGESVAERYRLHEGIESHKAAAEYRRHSETLGFDPIEDSDFQALEKHRGELCAKYGKPFKESYGWAGPR